MFYNGGVDGHSSRHRQQHEQQQSHCLAPAQAFPFYNKHCGKQDEAGIEHIAAVFPHKQHTHYCQGGDEQLFFTFQKALHIQQSVYELGHHKQEGHGKRHILQQSAHPVGDEG